MALWNSVREKLFVKVTAILLAVFCCLLCVDDAAGAHFRNFYQSCIYGMNLDMPGVEETVTVYPVNPACAIGCQSACNTAFSQQIPTGVIDPSDTQDTNQMVELNESAIYDCISACQQGNAFSTWIMVGTTKQKQLDPGDTSMTDAVEVSQLSYNQQYVSSGTVDECQGASSSLSDATRQLSDDPTPPADTNFVKTVTHYATSDTVTISVDDTIDDSTDDPDNGRVYMCGRKSVTLTPVFPNLVYLYPDVVTGGDAQQIADYTGPELPNRQYFDYTAGGMSGATQQAYLKNMIAQWDKGSSQKDPSPACTNFGANNAACTKHIYDTLLAPAPGSQQDGVIHPDIPVETEEDEKEGSSGDRPLTWGDLWIVDNYPHKGNLSTSARYNQCWPPVGGYRHGVIRGCKLDLTDGSLQAAVQQCANNFINPSFGDLKSAGCPPAYDDSEKDLKKQVTPAACQKGQKAFITAMKALCAKSGVAYQQPPQEWTLTDAQKNMTPLVFPLIEPRKTHPCFVGLTDSQWNSLSNYDLFSCYNSPNGCPVPLDSSGNPIDLTVVQRQNCFWDYHIRSDTPTKTGIYYAEQDDLSISFAGGPIVTTDGTTFSDYKTVLMNYFAANGSQSDVDTMSSMTFKLNGVLYSVQGEELRGVTSDSSSSSTGGALQLCSTSSSSAGPTLAGTGIAAGITPTMNGSVMQNVVETAGQQGDSNQCSDSSSQCFLLCSNVVRPGQVVYKFSYSNATGVSASDLPTQRQAIEVQHPQFDSTVYQAVHGGVQVKIDWGGCPILAGDNLQVAYRATTPAETDWIDVGLNDANNRSVTIAIDTFFPYAKNDTTSEDRYLYFRIKGFAPASSGDQVVDDLYTAHNRMGHYNIKVLNNGTSSLAYGPLYKLVRTVDRTLFGDVHAQFKDGDPGFDPNNIGVVSGLFSAVVQDSTYVPIINAVLILFVALTALIYMMGLTNLDVHDGLMRVLQIGLIATMISPMSWAFFGGQAVSMFVDGALSIADGIVGSQYISQLVANSNIFDTDKFAIFQLFTQPIQIMFSSDNMARLLTLLLSSVLGFVMFIGIICAGVMCVIALTKATVFFISCLMVESVLIILSPLTVPMILFKHTRGITIRWLKQMISYALQPIFLFAAISIFNTITIIALLGAFSFTVCPKCLISIPLPLFNSVCLLYGHGSIVDMHYPDGIDTVFAFPLAPFVAAALFAAVSSMMYRITSIVADIVPRLVGGDAAMGGGVAAAATSNAQESAKTAVKDAWNTTANTTKLAWQAGRAMFYQTISNTGDKGNDKGGTKGGGKDEGKGSANGDDKGGTKGGGKDADKSERSGGDASSNGDNGNSNKAADGADNREGDRGTTNKNAGNSKGSSGNDSGSGKKDGGSNVSNKDAVGASNKIPNAGAISDAKNNNSEVGANGNSSDLLKKAAEKEKSDIAADKAVKDLSQRRD